MSALLKAVEKTQSAGIDRASLLAAMQIMDTPQETVFDALTRLACSTCATPIAGISLLDNERVWLKSAQGLDFRQAPIEQSFSLQALGNAALFQINDTHQSSRFANNPLVTQAPFARFYAGQPLTVRGVRIGTLCVLDRVPRQLGLEQQRALIDLGAIAQHLFAQRLEANVADPNKKTAPGFNSPAGGQKQKNVVYVEDNRLNALLLEQLFEPLGNTKLTICATVSELYQVLQVNVPDLLLLDINLPGSSGLDILAWLKRTPATAQIRVIMVSADATGEAVGTAQSLGAEDFWTKPLNLAKVLAVLDTIQ
jgi:CheY-like chemotaxis protein